MSESPEPVMNVSPPPSRRATSKVGLRFSLFSLLCGITILAACLPILVSHGSLGLLLLLPTALMVSGVVLLSRAGRWKAGLLLGLLYLALWAVTAWFGTAEVRDHVRSRIMAIRHRRGVDLGPFAELNNDPKRIRMMPKPASPWFFVGQASAPCPFVVAVDYSYLAGELDGEGGRAYFLWLFGYKYFAIWRFHWCS